jgi:hypothetical protein
MVPFRLSPVLAALSTVALAACSGPTIASAPAATTTTPPPVQALSAPGPDQTGEMICQTSAGSGLRGGVYYIAVTSKDTHDFSACQSASPTSMNIDQLLTGPGNVNRRCFLDVNVYHSLAAVYSDERSDDLRAARQRCSEPGATTN